jgi:hypothetical protein
MEDLAVKRRTEEKSYSIVVKRKYPHWKNGKETTLYKRMKKARVGSTPRIDMEELM